MAMYLSPVPGIGLGMGTDAYVGALLFTYAAGTTTKQDAYTDSTGGTVLPNPIVLNSRGEVAASATGPSCGLWLDPTLGYKLVFATPDAGDPPTDTIWTLDQVVSAASDVLAQLAEYEAMLGGIQIGTQVAYGGPTPPTGWLFCDGSAVSRSTYSALFGVLGTSYGSGDGSSTFNLPDKRGCVSAGADNMNGAAANRLTFAGSAINSTVVGSIGGNELLQGHTHDVNDPGHSHDYTDPGHRHSQFYTGSFPGSGLPEGGVSGAVGPGTQSPDMYTASVLTGIGIEASTTGLTVLSTGNGSSQNVQPTQIDNWIVYAGA